VSAIINPSATYQTKSFFSKIGDKIKSVLPNIQSSSSSECEDLLPKYLLIGQDWGELKVRKGESEGENTNYYYLEDYPSFPAYQNKVIDENGVVLGTTKIVYSPVLNEIDLEWSEDLIHYIETLEREVVGENIVYTFSWEGLTDEVKEIIGTNVKIIVKKDRGYMTQNTNPKTFCEEEISNKKGTYNCDIDENEFDGTYKVIYIDGIPKTERIADIELGKQLKVNFEPEIFKKSFYEIVDYRISECEIVEG
jgi:hypothetical protein